MKKTKKIALFIPDLKRGGAERVSSLIMNSLSNEYHFYLVMLHDCVEFDIPSNVEKVIIGNGLNQNHYIKFLLIFFYANRFSNFCKRKKIDISFSMSYRTNYMSCLSKKIFFNSALLMINERSFASKMYYSNSLSDRVNRFLIKLTYNWSDIVLSNSKESAKDLEDNFGIKNRVKIIYNPLKIQRINNLKKNNLFTFICVANFQTYKNHELLIRAFSKVDTPSKLQLIGIGENLNKMKTLVKALNIHDRVEFLGHQKNVQEFLSKSHCFVFPSTVEGFPNGILEAMAAGLPIISSDCSSGPREILAPLSDFQRKLKGKIEFAEYGILFPNGNADLLIKAMRTILKDKKLLSQYSSQSLKRCLDFEISKTMSVYQNLFNEN